MLPSRAAAYKSLMSPPVVPMYLRVLIACGLKVPLKFYEQTKSEVSRMSARPFFAMFFFPFP